MLVASLFRSVLRKAPLHVASLCTALTLLASAAALVCISHASASPLAIVSDDPPAPEGATVPVAAPPAQIAPAGFATGDALLAQFDTLMTATALSGGRNWSKRTLGYSLEKRPIDVYILGDQDLGMRRPALLLVGGLDAEQLASPSCVVESVAAVLRDKPAVLDGVRIYAIPLANPDARAVALATKSPRATNARKIDHDRDGLIDDDAPTDLNGDGVITSMRSVAPPGKAATHLCDAADTRIVRGANRDKGERATHVLSVEGVDADGDSTIGEDPRDGVDLDRNFPHRYPEFSADAGAFQLSEPESMAIATFVREHPEILSAVVFGRHDTLVNFPDTKDNDSTGKTPMVYHPDDHALYREIAKLWKETTKIERSANHDLAGSLVLWLANHRGIAAVAANGWTRPDAPKLPEGTPEPPETGDAEQAAWLAVSDRLYGGAGFRPWTTFPHPTLGDVEIGGFAPFFRESPNAEQAATLAKASSAFVTALADRQPKLEVSDPRCTVLADGLVRVELRITNTGSVPTATAMSTVTDVAPPIIVRLPLAPSSVLAGRPIEKIERIAPGESREFTWLLRVDPKEMPSISVTGAWFDPITCPISPATSQEAAR
ncbi:MAG: M14 family zinc carboxypeptidase [bacterium]